MIFRRPAPAFVVPPRLADGVCLLLLTMAALALHHRTLRSVSLNTDESAYEAIAAYLLATGKSVFSLDYLSTTVAVYKAMAALFGPYNMMPMRVLILLLAIAMGIGLYLAIGRVASRWAGLVAALTFLHLAQFFEGRSANREWFCIVLLCAGMAVAWRAPAAGRRRAAWLFMAGALGSAACTFKEQVLPMAVAPAVGLAVDGWMTQRRIGWADVISYASGGIVAAAAFVGLLWCGGGLADYAAFFGLFSSEYVQGNQQAVASSGSGAWWEMYSRRLLNGLHGAGIFGIAYAMAGAAALRLLARPAQGSWADNGRIRLAFQLGLQIAAAAVAVQMGHRFFDHYYLLMLPAAAGLFGLGGYELTRPGSTRWRDLGVVVCTGWLALQAESLTPPLFGRAPTIVTAAAILATVFFGQLRQARPWLVGGLLLLSLGGVMRSSLDVRPAERIPPEQLLRWFEANAGPNTRLLVWGWTPEVYSFTRMTPASQIVVSNMLVGDHTSVAAPPRIEPSYERMLMRDLSSRKPDLILDSWCMSLSMAHDGTPVYDLRRYPDFELNRLIATHYEPIMKFRHDAGSLCTMYRLRRFYSR